MTRGRLLFAVGFAVAVSTVIILRDEGYLLGRQRGGPLDLGTLRAARRVKAGHPARFTLPGSLADGPVQVQDVRPIAHSPELFFTKRVNGHSVEKGMLAPDDLPITFGLRARRPGLYYLVGLIVDSRRGPRRFRAQRNDEILCIAVATRQTCDLSYRGPGHARVAQIGGPSAYPGADLTAAAATFGPGDHVARITLTNRHRSAVAVTDLPAQPATVRLGPRGHRIVRVHLHCDGHRRMGRLPARIDGARAAIPLSLPLACAG